jgi:hypothetical protein
VSRPALQTAEDIGITFTALSGTALEDERANISLLCEQAGVFTLNKDNIIEDIVYTVEKLDALMAEARLDLPRRELARVRVLQHCRTAGIKDARTLIDAVLKHQPTKPKPETSSTTITLTDDEPVAEAVDGTMLLDETAARIRRHVILRSTQADACALFVGTTYVIDALDLVPMALVTSKLHECGKSTLGELFAGLVPRPVKVASLTPAVLYRLVEKYHPTLIADEVDSWLNDEKSELRGVFNASVTRSGAIVPRCVGDSHEIGLFNVFGAKVLCMIGKPPATMLSRSIVITLRRRLPGERIEPLREDRLRAQLAPLRQQWRRWALDHLEAVRAHDPPMPEGLPENRTADNWRPLLTVADLVGGEWPARARAAALDLSGVRVSDEQPIDAQLLADVRTVFEDRGDPDYLSSEDIITVLRAMTERPWADWNKGRGMSPAQLANRLRDFGDGSGGLHTRETRIGTKTGKRWHREDFFDAWARYTPSNPQHPQQPNRNGPELEISEPQHSQDVAGCEDAILSMNTGSVAGVADSNPNPEGVSEKTEPDVPVEVINGRRYGRFRGRL